VLIEKLDIGAIQIVPQGDFPWTTALFLMAEMLDIASESETVRLKLGFISSRSDRELEFEPPLPKNLVPDFTIGLQTLLGWEDGDACDALTLAIETAIASEAQLEMERGRDTVRFTLKLGSWSATASAPRNELPAME